MLTNLQHYRIVLGSNSPRRKELLAGLDLKFEVEVIPGIDESYPDDLTADEIPAYIARKKAEAYLEKMTDNELLITADTIVVTYGQPDRILGKPADREEAIEMLCHLSDHVHEVITGVCLTTKQKTVFFSVSSAVAFSKLEKDDIIYYVDKYRPYDKAGSYGIQEWIGYVGVEAINGSFYNVMGLPVQRLYQELKKF
ncbi:Maf-like protein [Parabacteroides goldsteinii]|uniref:dTTP/UTP pyrophosphatase n=1 Tax=Parabacteroides goldsteinii DSM 19448 = WAL 12034 TaxID=927665 RepID=A0A0F5JAX5_9BACT|nr:Maf-like protein [Parabacteroides goldsteinii]KKB54665.1 maf-like protein [Parabacteroides goldsteinii DSM 19448 = WAL 12034]